MFPDPLHPVVVHFPIVLAVLLPIFAGGAVWAIHRGTRHRRVWALPFALVAALAASGWLAVRTGEAEEDRVEAVVGEAVLHEHEEAAERFLVLSGLVLLVAGVGLLGGNVGSAGRFLATAGSVGLLVAAVQVGSAGGELVYVHGAAQPYLTSVHATDALPAAVELREENDG